jgi:hypothetical protein
VLVADSRVAAIILTPDGGARGSLWRHGEHLRCRLVSLHWCVPQVQPAAMRVEHAWLLALLLASAAGSDSVPPASWLQSWQPSRSGAAHRQLEEEEEGAYAARWEPSWVPESMHGRSESQCNGAGRSLVSLHSLNDTRALAELAFDAGSSNAATWIGLRWEDSSANWSWSDGSALDFVPPGSWDASVPGNASMCVVANAVDEGTLSWATARCSSKRRYVCGGVLDVSTATCTGNASLARGFGACDDGECAAVGMARCGDSCVVHLSAPPADCTATFEASVDDLSASCPLGCDYSTGSERQQLGWQDSGSSCMSEGANSAFDILCPADRLSEFVYGDGRTDAYGNPITTGLMAFLEHCDDRSDPNRFELCTQDPSCPDKGADANATGTCLPAALAPAPAHICHLLKHCLMALSHHAECRRNVPVRLPRKCHAQ